MRGLRRQARMALLGLIPLVLTSGTVQAQGLFEFLFGRPARTAPAPRYVPEPFVNPFGTVPEQPRPRREPSHRGEAAVVPPPVMPKQAKPARVAPDSEIVASLMADATLQRGDIVVFPDGPRVFRGQRSSRRTIHDFEDLRTSRLVDGGTREKVLAGAPSLARTTVATAKETPSRAQRRTSPDDVTVTGSTTQRVGIRTP